MENFELKKLKYYAFFLIVLLVFNSFLVIFITFINDVDDDKLIQLNVLKNETYNLNSHLSSQRSDLISLNQTFNDYESAFLDIKGQYDDITSSNDDSLNNIGALKEELNKYDSSNLVLENEILNLEVQLR